MSIEKTNELKDFTTCDLLKELMTRLDEVNSYIITDSKVMKFENKIILEVDING